MENKTEEIKNIGLEMEIDAKNEVENLVLKKEYLSEENVEGAVLKRLVDPSEVTKYEHSENKYINKLTKVENDSSMSGVTKDASNVQQSEVANVVEFKSVVNGNLVIGMSEDSFVVENDEKSVKETIDVNGFNLKMEANENLVQENECSNLIMKNNPSSVKKENGINDGSFIVESNETSLIKETIHLNEVNLKMEVTENLFQENECSNLIMENISSSGKEENVEMNSDLLQNDTSFFENESKIKSTIENNDTSVVHPLNEDCKTTKDFNPYPEFDGEDVSSQECIQGYLGLDEGNNIQHRVDEHNIYESFKSVKSHSDHSTVLSNGNVCVTGNFNSSLNQIMNYSSDSDTSEAEGIQDNLVYRQQNKVFSEDSDTDSESDLSSSSSSTSLFFSNLSDCENSNEDDNCGAIKKTTNNNKHCNLKTKGELSLVDLPPVEDLNISVLEDECLPIGKVFQIVDQLVVVQSLKQTPVVDLDSILFVEGGKPLGQVFDVFGPVTEPYYCVRFNSNQQIKDRNIQKDQTVYIAPKTEHTSYVFLSQLLKLKGSDASWSDNNEPPKNCLDYSDDEQERVARKSQKTTVKTEVVDVDEPVRKRPSVYEQRMNERNLRMSDRAGFSKSGHRTRVPHGKPLPKSEIIWAPTMCPSPQSPIPRPTFSPTLFNNSQLSPINNMQLLPPSSNYQFGRSPFPPAPQINHQFSNASYQPYNPQFTSSPLPSSSPVIHQFRGSPFPPPPHLRQFPNPPHLQLNPQFSSSHLPPPSSVNHQFRGSPFRPPMYQFGSSMDRFNF